MSNKQKRAKPDERRAKKRAEAEKARMKKLVDAGRIANGVVMPEGAVAANLAAQAPNNSYGPPLYYVDQPFTCVDCGVEQLWTATQQKWYYEVAKGPIYAIAKRCRACRRKHRSSR